jgi:prepilin-type N-terminal cleavage/methylation domain-containing protein
MTIKNKNGFSFIELMIGLALVGFIVITVFDAFLGAYRHQRVQERVTEVQQLERISLEFITRDLRITGLDPEQTTNAGVVAVGDNVLQLTLDSFQDLNRDGDYDDAGEAPNGALDLADEGITYRRENVSATTGLGDLTKELGGFSYNGFNIPSDLNRPKLTVAQGVRQFRTAYNAAPQTVDVTLEMVEREEDPRFLNGIDLDGTPGNGTAHSRLIQTTVTLRNLLF